jgi:hypothetical protein
MGHMLEAISDKGDAMRRWTKMDDSEWSLPRGRNGMGEAASFMEVAHGPHDGRLSSL